MLEDGTVIVAGAGQAGAWAAASMRTAGFAGRIVLVGDEPHRPYERPPLSKELLRGEDPDPSIHPADAFDAQNLELRIGHRVEAISLDEHTVTLTGPDTAEPEVLAYDRLILTTGGRPRPAPFPGGGLPGVLTLRTIEDARVLAQQLRTGAPVAVVGGGWIGLEVAAAARGHGCPTTVLEFASRLCPRTVPPVISAYLLRLHESHGVDVRLGAQVSAIVPSCSTVTGCAAGPADGHPGLVVQCADGTEIPAATVVVGVGLIPNDEVAAEAGIVCDNGIVVDAACRTSDPAVFAAGDVTVSPNPYSGVPVRLESWQNAQEQGAAAGRSALGIDTEHAILPWFWSDQYQATVQIYGLPQEHHVMTLRGDPEGEDFTVLYTEGDRLKAAMGPGNAREIKLCRRIIDRQIPIDVSALADPSVALPRR
ncbi:MAG: NAD(P)/FAD-dependent oxidoreductase [Actinomycetales bacterium]